MSASSISSSTSSQSIVPQQARAVDRDGDKDNDLTESKAKKSAETGGSANSLPSDVNRGRNLNITA